MDVWTGLTGLLLTSRARTPGDFDGSRSRSLLRMTEFPPTLPKIKVIDLVIEVMFVNSCSSLESL